MQRIKTITIAIDKPETVGELDGTDFTWDGTLENGETIPENYKPMVALALIELANALLGSAYRAGMGRPDVYEGDEHGA